MCCDLEVFLIEVEPSKIEGSASFQPDLIITKKGEVYSVAQVTPNMTFTINFIPGLINEWDLFSSGDVAEVYFNFLFKKI